MSWLSERKDESSSSALRLSPYAHQAEIALERLGFRVDVPLTLAAPAYGRVLPIAERVGFHGALRTAFAEGTASPHDSESQLQWLADHLSLRRPSTQDAWPWWERAWCAAAAAAQVEPPSYLDAKAARALIDELLTGPDYPGRLTDALAVAFTKQAQGS